MLYRLHSRIIYEHLFVYLIVLLVLYLLLTRSGKLKILNQRNFVLYISIISLFIYFADLVNIFPIKGVVFFNSNLLTLLSFRSELFSNADTYADALKLFLSYDHVFKNFNLSNKGVPYEWIYANPFKNELGYSAIANMHLPPFYSVHNNLLARGFKYSQLNLGQYFYLYLIIYLLVIFLVIKNNTNRYTLFLYFSSFPSLFLIQRGNIVSGICSVLIFIYISNVLKNKNKILNLFLLILAASYRPNLLLLSLLLITPKNLRDSIKKLTLFFSSFLAFNYLNLILLKYLYPNYSFENFLIGYRWLTDNHIDYGDGFDSSSYRVVKSFLNITDYTQQRILQLMILIFLIGIAIYLLYQHYNQKIPKLEFSLALFCISLISVSPIGDYHLVSIALFVYLIFEYGDVRTKNKHLILLGVILIPKFHNSLYELINYSLYLNNASLILIVYLVGSISFISSNSSDII